MSDHNQRDLPLRSKRAMVQDVGQALRFLHEGGKAKLDVVIRDLKTRSIDLEENVQQSVLIFSEQVDFQYAYDPWHLVTRDITRAADRLIAILRG